MVKQQSKIGSILPLSNRGKMSFPFQDYHLLGGILTRAVSGPIGNAQNIQVHRLDHICVGPEHPDSILVGPYLYD